MIEEAVRMWEMFREGFIGELINIPEEQWEWRPGQGARDLRELALHVTAAGKGFVDELLAEETKFIRLRDPKVQEALMASLGEAKTKEDMIRLVRVTGAEGFARLREHGERLSTATMATQSGEQSREAGIWFAASHEMYHRGQVATYARALGIVPAMTQRIEGARK